MAKIIKGAHKEARRMARLHYLIDQMWPTEHKGTKPAVTKAAAVTRWNRRKARRKMKRDSRRRNRR